MEDGRAETHHAHCYQDEEIVLCESKQHQAYQREAHADGEGVGARMLVGIQSGERLQNGGGHLKHQRDDANLGERETKLVLDDGVDGGDDRLYHVVEKMRDATDDEHRIHRALCHRRVALDFVSY